MNMSRKTAGAVLGVTLFVGSLIGGGSGLFAQGPDLTPPAATSESKADQVQEPSYTGSTSVDEAQYEGMSEADEAAALQELATISPEEAQATAEAANPGSTATEVELDDENGSLVYSVELDNGLEVQVDAGDGTILHTEQEGHENEAHDDDDDDENEAYDDDDDENEADDDDADDAAESAALQELATISAADAEAAALADYPGATVVETELDKENGQVVYEVELDNGTEVIVDAADGTVLGTEIDD